MNEILTSDITDYLENKNIWIVGHKGMVGSALCRVLQNINCNVLELDRTEIDLRQRFAVDAWVESKKPDLVVVAAAKVGGILANSQQPVTFLNDNLQIQDSVINACANHSVEKLLFLGSSCIYPKHAEQPIEESSLLTGKLEPTNEWYAIAKIAGVKLCQAYQQERGLNFISAMPTNLYGPNDNFDPNSSHVLPGMMGKFHTAKERGAEAVTLWGTGNPKREFMHVDDLATACLFLLAKYDGIEPINVGSGEEVSISELAQLISKSVGFQGEIEFDKTKPDGTPRKLLSSERLQQLGWQASTGIQRGIEQTYEWFLENELEHYSKRVSNV